jgi:hypothetical protein
MVEVRARQYWSRAEKTHPMNWEFPPQDFRFILFDRTEPEKNARRFYLIGWMLFLII